MIEISSKKYEIKYLKEKESMKDEVLRLWWADMEGEKRNTNRPERPFTMSDTVSIV